MNWTSWGILCALWLAPVAHASSLCLNVHAQLVGKLLHRAEKHGTKVAVPKTILREGELGERYPNEVAARYESADRGLFVGRDGTALPYRIIRAPNERGSVVLVPGLSESMTYYKELIYTLTEEGYTVYTYDSRGHGEAMGRARNPKVVHVKNFTEYVDDLDWFLTDIVHPKVKDDYTVLGNSNGSLTTLRLAQRELGLIPSLIAISPPLRLRPALVPQPLLHLGVKTSAALFGYEALAPTQKRAPSVQEDIDKVPYRSVRHNLQAAERERDPNIARGGASNQWVLEVMKAGKLALARPHYLKQPALFITGTADPLINANVPLKFAARIPTASTLSISGGKHHLLFEKDKYRDPALTEVLRFLVNTTRLDKPAKPNELAILTETAANYLKRDEPAFARYAMDEALRVYAAKREQTPKWQHPDYAEALEQKSAEIWRLVENMPPAQAALYAEMTKRRLAEIERAYPTP